MENFQDFEGFAGAVYGAVGFGFFGNAKMAAHIPQTKTFQVLELSAPRPADGK